MENIDLNNRTIQVVSSPHLGQRQGRKEYPHSQETHANPKKAGLNPTQRNTSLLTAHEGQRKLCDS